MPQQGAAMALPLANNPSHVIITDELQIFVYETAEIWVKKKKFSQLKIELPGPN